MSDGRDLSRVASLLLEIGARIKDKELRGEDDRETDGGVRQSID